MIECSRKYPDEDELKSNLSSLNKKLSSLLLRTEHQILVTKRAKNNHDKNQAQVEKYKKNLVEIEEWLKFTILRVEKLNSKPESGDKIEELGEISAELEEKERTVKLIQNECEKLNGSEFRDIQTFVKELLLGLTMNLQVIRENQRLIKLSLEKSKEQAKDEIVGKHQAENVQRQPKDVESHAISTQTVNEPSSDNIMVIQSMSSEGETIQISTSSLNENSKLDERNVIVEAKYVRDHSGDNKKSSELILKNVPKQFESTFIEPDETTTEIIVDPDGSKRIIVRKLTKSTTQQIVTTHEEIDTGTLPEHIRSQLTQSGVTHDVIIGSADDHEPFESAGDVDESSIHAVVERVTHKIIKKTRRIVRKVVNIDGKEEIFEEIVDEPEEIEQNETISESSLPEIVDIIEPYTEIVEVQSQQIITETKEIPEKEQKYSVEVSEIVPEAIESNIIPEHPEVEEIKLSGNEEKEPDLVEKLQPEGEIETNQVFDSVTEQHVDQLDVDKAPVEFEDIKEIWPAYEMSPASTNVSITAPEAASTSAKDERSHAIWPQNLSTGSNIVLEEYQFEGMVKPLNQLKADESPLVTNHTELKEESTEIKAQEISTEDIQNVVSASEIENDENPEIINESANLESRFVDDEVLKPSEQTGIESPKEAHDASDESVYLAKEIDDVFEKSENLVAPDSTEPELAVSPVLSSSRPMSPLSRPMSPQKATITIVKTMTFLEQEKINSQALMIVRTEPVVIAEEPIDTNVSQADRSLPDEVLEVSQLQTEPVNKVCKYFL